MKPYLTLAAGVWVVSAFAAAAQEAAPESGPVCAGVASTWIGGTAEGSVVGTDSAPLVQQASASASQVPVFAFRIDGAAQETRIEAAAVAGGDPYITLTAPDGRILVENDDYGGGLNAQAVSLLEPGDYCVRLSSVGGEAISATVQVSRTDQTALLPEAADTTIAACLPSTEKTPLADGPLGAALAAGRVSRDIGSGVAYLGFDLAEEASLTLRAESEMLDPQIKLYDGAGVLLAENDDADGLNARLDFLTALPPGSYCLAAGPLSAGEGTVNVSVETLDRDSYLRGAWRRGELAPPEGADYPVQAIDLAKEKETMMLHDGAAQWLAFDIPEETVLIVSSFGQLTGADTRLTLFGASGIPVATADDSEAGLDAKLGPVVLGAGRYRLAVMDVGSTEGATGGPIRPIGLVFERFTRVK
ncbi:MAG: hypothetical protein ACRC6I_09410 [Paracoccaceae bacterium]